MEQSGWTQVNNVEGKFVWRKMYPRKKLRSSRGGLASIQVTFLYVDMMVNFMSYLDQAAGSQIVKHYLQCFCEDKLSLDEFNI